MHDAASRVCLGRGDACEWKVEAIFSFSRDKIYVNRMREMSPIVSQLEITEKTLVAGPIYVGKDIEGVKKLFP